MARHKSLSRLRQLLDEGLAHFRADFKGLRADGRAEPDQYVFGRNVQRIERRFQHACRQPAPTGMGRRDTSAGTVAKQRRQAVGGHRRTGDARR
ncbi:hypothetical protein D3C84_1069530 [compost metagenome]